MTRDEHLAWCKKRALEYVDDWDVRSAICSMMSDLQKHPETKDQNPAIMALGLLIGRQVSAHGGDVLSMALGPAAWKLIGRPTSG